MKYVLKCVGYNDRRETINTLTADGSVVHRGSYGKAWQLVRGWIKPGDTYTEGRAMLTYEQMQKQYADCDAFDRGEF